MPADELVVAWQGRRLTLVGSASPVSIGRDPAATVHTTSAVVSRQHAELTADGDGWTFRDAGSAQGSFLDGVRVGEMRLRRAVRIRLGVGPDAVELELVPSGARPRTAPQSAPRAAAGPADTVLGVGAPGTVVAGGAPVATTAGLRLTATGREWTARADRVTTIGRDETNDVVLAQPGVSRRHASVSYVDGRWTLTDEASSGGTWVDGARVDQVGLTSGMVLRLGDAHGGADLVVDGPPVAEPGGLRGAPARVAARLGPRGLAAVGAGLAVVLAVALAATLWPRATGADELARATVRIQTDDGWGSGTVVDARRGLILTNAHVASPDAPGLAVMYRDHGQPEGFDDVVVLVAPDASSVAEPRFLGEVVAADGYLDLAVVRITRTLGGAPVQPEDLRELAQVPLGRSDEIHVEDEIRIFGYPRAAESDAPTVTRGVVAGVVPDDDLDLARGYFNVDAEISPGNSGGLAADMAGRLVGVPTLLREGRIGSIRPIALATPLLDAARAGDTYTSPHLTASADGTQIVDVALAAPGTAGTVREGCSSAGAGPLALALQYTGVPQGGGVELAVSLTDESGQEFWADAISAGSPALPTDGCVTATLGDLPDGSYELWVGAGSTYATIYESTLTLS